MAALVIYCPRCHSPNMRVDGLTTQACRHRRLNLDLFIEVICEQCGNQPTLLFAACRGRLGFEWYRGDEGDEESEEAGEDERRAPAAERPDHAV